MDIGDFVDSGGLSVVLFIVGALFAVQAVITFLLWRKGDETYFLKFLSYAIATAAILILGIGLTALLVGSGSGSTLMALIIVFEIFTPIAIGIQIYIFIRDNWLSKETG